MALNLKAWLTHIAGFLTLSHAVMLYGRPVASTTAYTYDAANNRERKTVTGGSEPCLWSYYYNNANQLTGWNKYTVNGYSGLKSATLTYDLNGNRTSQIIGGTADDGGVNPPNKANGTTSYTWDNTNRLASVTMPDGKQFSYTYDYRMRRVATHASGTGVTPKHTSIVFSGGLSVSEYESASAPGSGGVPAATAPVVQYQRGPDMGGGIGGMLYSLRGTSGSLTPKYSLNNGRGDIVAQSDQSATLTWTASYEAHGRRTVETGVNEDKQRANSKDEDPTGLLNEGFRYRDLETGVWLSRDPAGFVDGPNLYAYVKQNPWTAFDPDGLQEKKAPASAKSTESKRVDLMGGGTGQFTKPWRMREKPLQMPLLNAVKGLVKNNESRNMEHLFLRLLIKKRHL